MISYNEVWGDGREDSRKLINDAVAILHMSCVLMLELTTMWFVYSGEFGYEPCQVIRVTDDILSRTASRLC